MYLVVFAKCGLAASGKEAPAHAAHKENDWKNQQTRNWGEREVELTMGCRSINLILCETNITICFEASTTGVFLLLLFWFVSFSCLLSSTFCHRDCSFRHICTDPQHWLLNVYTNQDHTVGTRVTRVYSAEFSALLITGTNQFYNILCYPFRHYSDFVGISLLCRLCCCSSSSSTSHISVVGIFARVLLHPEYVVVVVVFVFSIQRANELLTECIVNLSCRFTWHSLNRWSRLHADCTYYMYKCIYFRDNLRVHIINRRFT